MMIDCDACAVRGPACGDCVVTVLLGAPPANRAAEGESGIDLDGEEQAAIAVLAGSGLVPPLRLVAAPPSQAGPLRPAGRHEPRKKEDGTPETGRRAAV